jgi:preprotein translocase subunit YajC
MEILTFAMLIFFVGFIFFSNRKRRVAAQELASSLKAGSKAVMVGGIKGVITEVRDGSVILETVPGTKIEFLTAAVRSVELPTLDKKPTPSKATTKPKASAPRATAKPVASKKPAVKKPAK